MKEDVLHLFNAYPDYAFFVSVCISVIIAVLGVVPSVFLTAANVLFFGFWKGTLISFLGEAVGAVIAFILYRIGFKKSIQGSLEKYAGVKKLLHSQGRDAFYAIISLRLIPFVPSGLITFAAAIGKVDPLTFFISSSLGKFPALLIEAYAAYQVTQFNWQGKMILLVVGVYLLYRITRKKKP